MNKNDLYSTLGDVLKKFGFQKKAGSWYLSEQDVIKVVDLQKSEYSELFYVNLGIYFKGLDQTEFFPKEKNCHIRTRLNSLMSGSQIDYNYLFNLDELNINSEEFTLNIQQCVVNAILPQLRAIESKEGILAIIDKVPAFVNMILLKVKDFLHIPI